MNWKDFNSGEIDITNVGQALTDIRCPECGNFIFMDTTKVLTSYPPQYSYWCNCGWSGTSYRSWLKERPYKVVVGFNAEPGFYGAYANTCEDCELFVTLTNSIRGAYCLRAQGWVLPHNPACEDFAKRKEETDE